MNTIFYMLIALIMGTNTLPHDFSTVVDKDNPAQQRTVGEEQNDPDDEDEDE